MFKFLRVSALSLGALTIIHGARAQDTNTIPRTDFGAILKLSLAEQEPKVDEVYGLLRFFDWLLSLHDGSPAREYSASEQNELAIQILRLHPNATASSIHDDLISTNGDNQANGLRNLELLLSDPPNINPPRAVKTLPMSGVWSDAIYQDLAAIFRVKADAKIADHAAFMAAFNPIQKRKMLVMSALIQLGDARAIPLLIADDAAKPMLHYNAILILARQNSGAPELQNLVPLLSSDIAKVRAQATFALSATVPGVSAALPNLLNDADNNVRELAVNLAFTASEADYEVLRPLLQSKLTDTAPKVRFAVAKGLATKSDPASAPTLLALMQSDDPAASPLMAKQILRRLTGADTRFLLERHKHTDYLKPMDKSKTEKDDLEFIEAWIALHPAN